VKQYLVVAINWNAIISKIISMGKQDRDCIKHGIQCMIDVTTLKINTINTTELGESQYVIDGIVWKIFVPI